MTPEHARLTEALRELRTRTGLSLAALAERTTYSKSSWERYLNGRTAPPRTAARDLCRLAGEPEGRLLALWEIAESEWSGRAAEPAPAPSAKPTPDPAPATEAAAPSPARHRRLTALLACLGALAVAGAVAAALLLPRGGGEPGPPSAAPSAPGPRCRGAACEGQDPMHMYCGAGPDTLTTARTATGARVELRYSPRCRAGWARMWGTRVGDRLEVTAGGPTRGARIADEVDAESYVYTPMTAARPGTLVRACFRPAPSGRPAECVEARVRP